MPQKIIKDDVARGQIKGKNKKAISKKHKKDKDHKKSKKKDYHTKEL